jgi:hypothetical protein
MSGFLFATHFATQGWQSLIEATHAILWYLMRSKNIQEHIKSD